MRSARNPHVLFGLVVAACGTSVQATPDGASVDVIPCSQSYLTYSNFGEPFITDWCRGCHSAKLPSDMRQMAPPTVNFDTLDDIHMWSDRIVIRTTTGINPMPPAGGPSNSERALVSQWLVCGGKS